MPTRTIGWVADLSDPNSYGWYSIFCYLDGDDSGKINTQSKEEAEKHHAALVGFKEAKTPVELELSVNEKDTQPNKKGGTAFRINGYPGWSKPKSSGGGGGGGGYQGGGGRADWTYQSELERYQSRLSIEAQKSLDLATQTLAQVSTKLTAEAARDFVIETMKQYAHALREVVNEGSEVGSRPSWVGGSSGAGSGNRAVEGTAGSPSPSLPSQDRSTTPESLPSPASEPSLTADAEVLTEQLDELFGTRGKWQIAYKKEFKKPPIIEQMTMEELERLVAIGAQAALA